MVLDGKAGEGIDWDFDRLMEGADAEPDVDLEEPSGGVGMMYTSGTTGPPKGVVATKYDTSPLPIILGATGVKPGETLYTPLSLFHGNASPSPTSTSPSWTTTATPSPPTTKDGDTAISAKRRILMTPPSTSSWKIGLHRP